MNFQWLNESNLTKEGEKITIYAPAGTDFFCNDGTVSEEGVTPESLRNAPFYYTELSSDFVLTVKVSHDLKDSYDSSTLMAMEDLKNWAKSCFEKTDFGTHAAVSVVTKNGRSDDANGCNLSGNTAWLRICRVNNSFSFLYSEDGTHFYMTRFFNLSGMETVKVGMLAQAPQGDGGYRVYENLTFEKRTVKNIRAGE